MAVSYFIYVNNKEKNDFNLNKFNIDIKEKFPGVSVEVKKDENYKYDVHFEYYGDKCEFEFWIDRDRSAVAIDYFNSENRLYDYAKYIIWLRSYFSFEKEVLLCDEGYNKILVLSEGIEIEDILEIPE